tara:strand:- start:1734 stop:2252 length:519 start_codon:yes stop_codon:yes gene_type:complete
MRGNTMEEKLQEAIKFATEAHGDQKRKYTGEPYITHPIAVMEIVREVPHTEEMLMAAVLHDTVEDTPVTIEDIKTKFGTKVAELVNGLTDVSRPEDGNRKTRKAMDRAHLAKQNAEVQTIKLADLIHNTMSIGLYDPHFYKVYKEEKIKILDVLKLGNQTLMHRAQQQVGGS